MKKAIFIIFIFLSINSSLSCAQSLGNSSYNQLANNKHGGANHNTASARMPSNNKVFFTVNALMNVKADSYLAIFNLAQIGKTATEVEQLMANRINGFASKLSENGISEEAIYIDMISLVPVYEYVVEDKLFSKSYNEVPAGFEMQKNIHIAFTDVAKMEVIMKIAAENEIYDFAKLEYFVKNTEQYFDSLRQIATNNISKRVAEYQKLGLNLSKLPVKIGEDSKVTYPYDLYESYEAFSTNDLNKIKKRHSVTHSKKKVHLYYDKIPYDKFDIIINAEFNEPVVQFTFQMFVEYTLPVNEIPREKSNYFIINQDGTLKQLNIK